MKLVKDLMVPREHYATVGEDATMLDAILALEKAQDHLPPGRQPHRAVLVTNAEGRVVGKVGQLGFLRALESKHVIVGDMGKLARAGLSSDFVASMMSHMSLFQDDIPEMCSRARSVIVKTVMNPITESIDEDASLGEAIYKIVTWQTLSILVRRDGVATGVVRLSDLYDEIAEHIKASNA